MVRSTEDADLAATLAVVAQTLARENDLTGVILRTCRLAVETIDACEHADVMIVAPGGTLTVPAATDWVGIRIVSFEEEYGEGPCVDAFRTSSTIESPDFDSESRWPEFVRRCMVETPVRSGVGVPLVVGDRPIGALDLYADAPQLSSRRFASRRCCLRPTPPSPSRPPERGPSPRRRWPALVS